MVVVRSGPCVDDLVSRRATIQIEPGYWLVDVVRWFDCRYSQQSGYRACMYPYRDVHWSNFVFTCGWNPAVLSRYGGESNRPSATDRRKRNSHIIEIVQMLLVIYAGWSATSMLIALLLSISFVFCLTTSSVSLKNLKLFEGLNEMLKKVGCFCIALRNWMMGIDSHH